MEFLNLNFKRFGKDIVLNFMASNAVVATLQLFVYPFLSSKYGQNIFGSVLSLMGVVNTLALTAGGALDNVRLITYQDYEDKKLRGDFRLLIGYASVFCIFTFTVITTLFIRVKLIDILLLILVTLLTMMRSYLSVEYRLKVNYIRIFWYNFSTCTGYIIGILFSWLTGIWQITFLFGESGALIFAAFTTEFLKEPGKKTVLFNSTVIKYIQIAVSTMIGNVLIYLDRFIIYPFIGADQVAVFFAASMFGKIIGMVFQPVSGVLLTHFSQSKQKMKLKEFWRFNLVILALSGIFYIASLVFAPVLTGILYPNLMADALKILPVANLAAIISTMGALTQPVLLKFSSTHWQIVLQIIFGVTYILSGIILLKISGLFGFCMAALLSSSVRLIIMWIVGNLSLSCK